MYHHSACSKVKKTGRGAHRWKWPFSNPPWSSLSARCQPLALQIQLFSQFWLHLLFAWNGSKINLQMPPHGVRWHLLTLSSESLCQFFWDPPPFSPLLCKWPSLKLLNLGLPALSWLQMKALTPPCFAAPVPKPRLWKANALPDFSLSHYRLLHAQRLGPDLHNVLHRLSRHCNSVQKGSNSNILEFRFSCWQT